MLEFLLRLAGAALKPGRKGRGYAPKRKFKADHVNDWKAGKKARGAWLPHDEYVKRKKGK